jgi:hypothetical protein
MMNLDEGLRHSVDKSGNMHKKGGSWAITTPFLFEQTAENQDIRH